MAFIFELLSDLYRIWLEPIQRVVALSTEPVMHRKRCIIDGAAATKFTERDQVPIQPAYDFSFARRADQELTKAGWKP
jgi:hypothetical protein